MSERKCIIGGEEIEARGEITGEMTLEGRGGRMVAEFQYKVEVLYVLHIIAEAS